MLISPLIFMISMFPNRPELLSRRLAQMTNHGVWLIAFIFSFAFSSCAGSKSSSSGFDDVFIGEMKIKKVFGNFINAQALSIDAFGNIYVADAGAPGIYKFNVNGDSIRG